MNSSNIGNDATVGWRRLFKTGAAMTLSAGAIALLGGLSSRSAYAADPAGDVKILNVALGLEHEAIAAYQLGAESKLLQPAVLNVAVLFQSHHKGHRDALIAAIKQLGGTAVEPKAMGDYATALNASSIKSQTDILKLAERLEKGAANAYLGVIPSFSDKTLAQVCGRLAADETMHWTALAGALQDTLPAQPLSFGA